MSESWRKPFFRMILGQAASLISSNVVQFALIWYVTVRTGSALALTFASLAGLLPQVLLGPFAGPLIDRTSRKTVLILADAGVALSGLLLGLLFLLGEPPLGLVYLGLGLRALGEAFHKPAMKAAVPQLVPPSELERAGGLGQLVQAAAGIAGPLLGGLLTELLPMPAVMLVDAVGAGLAILALRSLPLGKPAAAAAPRAGLLGELREGWRAMKAVPGLLRASVPVFATSLVFLPLGSLLPLMVRQVFRGEALQNGIARALFSAGTLVAALAFGLLGGSKRPFLAISSAPLALGAAALFAGGLGERAFPAFCAAVFVMGMAGMWGNIPYTALIQRGVPAERLGTAMALVTSAMSLGVPLGMLVSGPLANAVGVPAWMRGAGLVLLLVGLFGFLSTRRFEAGRAAAGGAARPR